MKPNQTKPKWLNSALNDLKNQPTNQQPGKIFDLKHINNNILTNITRIIKTILNNKQMTDFPSEAGNLLNSRKNMSEKYLEEIPRN